MFPAMNGSDRFAPLRRAARVWAIAAVHGESQRLASLHAALSPRFTVGDRLVYLGNYLGRGGDIAGTIDELLRFRREIIARPGVFAYDVAYLRGSQEEMWQKLQQLQFAINPREVLDWMLSHGVGATLAAYGGDAKKGMAAARDGAVSITRWTSQMRAGLAGHPGHQALLSSLKRAAFTDDGSLLFVHAGIDATRPLAAQGDALWWGASGFGHWQAPYEGYRLVVRGYDHGHGGMTRGPFSLTIDDGCGFGGNLVAACIDRGGEVIEWIEA
jgi:serine/threonine protein phosphatase 1